MPWAIIHPVRRNTEVSILARVLLPLVLLALLGIAPRPHVVTRALWSAHLAIRQDVSPQFAARSARALAQAAEQIPWRSDLWELAGRLALQGKEPLAGITYFERAASQNALSLDGQITLGDSYAETGDRAAAIDAWESALSSGSPSTEVLTRLLDAHLSLGDYPAAVADLQGLTALHPADADLRFQLGLLLSTLQPEAALAHLAQAAELDPELDAKAQKLIASIRTGSLAGDPAQTLFEAGRALGSIGEWELAAQAFRQATLVRPDFADAWAFWGEARQQLQDDFISQPVPEELERALELDPSSLSANVLMALYYQRRARFDQALEYLRKATELYPQNPALYVELGEVLALSGDLEAALQAYQKTVELAPNDPAYYRLLAGFSARYEYQVGAVGLSAARRAVLLDPANPDSLDSMGQVLFLLGDLTSAERFFLRALDADPNHAPAHLHLGLAYMLQGERDRAYQEWKLVTSLASGTPAAEQAERLVRNYFP